MTDKPTYDEPTIDTDCAVVTPDQTTQMCLMCLEGTADNGASLTLTFNGVDVCEPAVSSGRWKCCFDPSVAGVTATGSYQAVIIDHQFDTQPVDDRPMDSRQSKIVGVAFPPDVCPLNR